MEGEQNLTYNDVVYKLRFYYGYNSHYYLTIFNNTNGEYLGEIQDIRETDDWKSRVKQFIDANL